MASGIWLMVGALVLVSGTRRIEFAQFATSRRHGDRVDVEVPAIVNGERGVLLVPGLDLRSMVVVRRITVAGEEPFDVLALRVHEGDVEGLRALSLWLFHTPCGAVAGLPDGVPVVALRPEGTGRR